MHFFARVLLLCYALCFIVSTHGGKQGAPFAGDLVKSGELRPLVSTEFGRVAGARVSDGNETFLLHFITLDPNSLFLPVLLHQDMVFYVHTGSGRLSYSSEKEMQTVDLERGDVFRLESGNVFFVQSNLDQERQKLRIYAIFGDAGEDLRDPVPYGPYSSIRDLILGFDNRTLQEAFKVPEEVIEELKGGQKPEAIIHGVQQTEKSKGGKRELAEKFLVSRGAFAYGVFDITTNKHTKKKSDLYNVFSEKRDFQNCNGWSTTVTRKKSSVFKNSKFGLFMVNLTHGGMMGPHWNPRASEIAVVLEGKGMVRVVCPGKVTDRECKSSRFAVEEGDVFVVPRFHPMAQLAFNNDSFVFVGFSTEVKVNHPQYIAGRASVLRTLDKQIMAMAFGVNETTLDRIVSPQGQSIILSCVSCAEEEYRVMTEEIQQAKEREEEEKRKQEEEARRKREEEEAARRAEEERKAEEEREKQREEEEKQKQEEEARRAEEERKAEEEREKQREEEEKRKQEEEARKKREQEEAAKQAEEERKAEEERERKQREEEEAQRQKEEEERQAEQEREAQRQREEEERRAEKEREAQRQREEEKRREQEAEAARRAQQAAERAAEEERKREEEEARHQEQGGGQQPGGGSEQQPGGGQGGGGEQQPGGGQGGGGEQQPGGGQGGGREQQPGGGQGGEQQPGGGGQGGQGQGEQQPGGQGGEQQPGGGQGGQGGQGEQEPGGGGGEQQPGGSQGQGGEQQPGGGGREQQPGGGQGQGGEQQPGADQPPQEGEGTGYAWRIMI